MSRGFAVVMGIMLASSGVAQAADRPPIESWGKPGIAFDQYRADSVECAKIGYFRDVSQDEPAKRFIRGFETADRLMNFPSPADSGDDWMLSVVACSPIGKSDCYRRFRSAMSNVPDRQGLSKFTADRGEAKTLASYPRGSEARHRYLYTLAAR